MREKYLQITHLKEDIYPEYIKTAQNPVLRKQTTQFKHVQRPEWVLYKKNKEMANKIDTQNTISH